MRYWGYLAAKLGAAGLILYGIAAAVLSVLPRPAPIRGVVDDPFGHSLGYTVGIMIYTVASSMGLLMIIWDHRYRCRTCLRRTL